MLKLFSRMERTRSFVIIIFASLMVLSLIFFYAPNRGANAAPATSTEAVASVNGEEVTVGEMTMMKERYAQMFGGQISMAQLGGDKRILDGLIRDRIVSQEAARLGLAPSDAEVRDSIRKQFADATGKFIGFDKYKDAVLSQFGDLEGFERQVRDTLAAKKLRAYITAGARVSEAEVEEDYKRKSASFDLVYVPVLAAELAKGIKPSDEDVQKYFDDHKEEFRVNEPQKNIRYLFVDQAKVGERIQISDEELRKEYESLKPENKQAGVKVQQIVLKVARPELDQQVLQKASELVAQARDEKLKATEEKFAELARGNSEDAATAKQGGALPGLVRKNPKKPDDILQNTLAMQPGDVGDPLKTGNAYYIFRRGESVEKTFDEAKQELLVSLRNRKAYAAAATLASRAAQALKETKDLPKTAAAFAAESNTSASAMVRETGFVKPGDEVKDIGVSAQFEEGVAPLQNAGDVGERTPIKGGFAIPVLAEKRDPRIPDFAEVKDKAAERVRQERAKSQLEQAARDLANNAGTPDALKAAAEKLGLKAEPLPVYRLGTPLGEVGTSAAADEAINNLKAGEVSKTPVKIADSWVVLGVTKRTEADMAEYAKQRGQLLEAAVSARRNQVYEDYITATRARFERDGDIKIYDDVLKRLAEADPSAAPPDFPVAPTEP